VTGALTPNLTRTFSETPRFVEKDPTIFIEATAKVKMSMLFSSLQRRTSLLVAGLLLAGQASAITSRVTDQRYRWKSVAIVAGGFVSGILFHPKQRGLAYARTDIGGAYRWDDRAHAWVPLQDWLSKPDWNLYGIESIGLDPSNPRKLYLACGTYTNEWGGNGAILRSNDQGRTFERTDLPFKLGGNENGRGIGERLAVDPHDGKRLYFGTRNSGLWTSVDGAKTWGAVESFPVHGRTNGIGVGVVLFDPRSGSRGQATPTIYVGVASKDEGLYRSRDSGKSWEPVPGSPKGQYPHHMALSPDGTLFIAFSTGPGPNDIGGGSVQKLDTNTGVWTDISPAKPNTGSEHGFGFAGLSLAPDGKTLVVSTLDRWNPGDDVFRSTDGGATWYGLRAQSSRDSSAAPYMTWGRGDASFGWWIGAVAMDPFDAGHVLYGTGANIWGTHDALQAASKWRVEGQGIEETADIDLMSPSAGPHLISAVGDIGGFTHLDLDKPATGMTVHPHFDNTDSLDYAANMPNLVVRVGRAGGGEKHCAYSQDGGLTWQPVTTEPNARSQSGSVAVTADGSTIVWVPQGAVPSFTKDLGATWSPSMGAPGGCEVVSDRVNPSLVFALARDGALYVSHDRGATFDASGAKLPARHQKLRATFGQEGDLWVPSEEGLFHSKDAGATFTKIAGVDSAESVGLGKAAPNAKYPAVFLNGQVDDQFGVFRSDDGASTWVKVTDAKHEYGTRGVVIGDPRIYGRLYLGTNGRGVFYADPETQAR